MPVASACWAGFLSTPSARRATDQDAAVCGARQNFYPRPPRGGRQAAGRNNLWQQKFLSTPSARRATHQSGHLSAWLPISIHALREEGDIPSVVQFLRYFISIHALREEGDLLFGIPLHLPHNFYPRPPRGGRLLVTITRTPTMLNFYPRPPRGGRQHPPGGGHPHQHISIHALREEGDPAT